MIELSLKNIQPHLYQEVEKLLVIQHLRNIGHNLPSGTEHTWMPGPDGLRYHCAVCGVSKCNDYGTHSTCESWLLKIVVDIINRRDRNATHFESLACQWKKFIRDIHNAEEQA